ncbi:MAG: permease-like cell division protein FtsX [Candidatus Paceibacterota bacterium]|nr:MAG: permease-like cell division protein FtsX [Candidatus Paceibacterota bacterium]
MSQEMFKRILRSGWTNFLRNSYVSFGTTGVMALVLFVFLGLMTLNVIANSITQSIEDKVDVSVYFKTTTAEEDILKIQQDIEALPAVAYVEYISREKAFEDFKARHAGNALIQESLAELDDNPLQASVNIKAKDSSEYAGIANYLEGTRFRPLIEKINFYENEQVIARVQSISKGLRSWGMATTLLLSIIAVLVTFNTVRLTIYTQHQEIEIMRLVGGSNWHIRAPFLVEGVLYGVFASLLSLAVFYPALSFISADVADKIPGVALTQYFISHAPQTVLTVLVIGVLLGVVSSTIAIRRFLRI